MEEEDIHREESNNDGHDFQAHREDALHLPVNLVLYGNKRSSLGDVLDQRRHSEDSAHPDQSICVPADGQEERDCSREDKKEVDDVGLLHEEDLSAHCDQSEQ